MAIYRQVYTTFWTDPKIIEDFSPEDKYFFLYLLTNPHTSITGCYEITKKSIAVDLGYDTDTVRKLIKRMIVDHRVLDYDEETREVLIFHWYKYNWSKSPNFVKGLKESVQYIKSIRFRDYILQTMKAQNIIDENDETWKRYRPSATIGDGMGTSVSVYYYNNNNSFSCLDNDSSIDIKDNVKNIEPTNVQSTLNVQEDEVEEAFTTFWAAYPKKVNKAYARKCFAKAIKKVSLDTLLSAIENQKQSVNWIKNNGQFIPDASTWLNNERWEDEIDIPVESKHVYVDDETPYEAAKWLSKKINKLHPDIEIEPEEILQKWAVVFDKMENDDKRDPNDILCVMRFVFESDFWKDKISNPWEFRKNYVKIRMQAEKEGKF